MESGGAAFHPSPQTQDLNSVPEQSQGGIYSEFFIVTCNQPNTHIDVINFPPKNRFPDPQRYYNVLFHDLIHSTGHHKRLNRPEVAGVVSFASEAYSKEELVAEMGSGFLCSYTGILGKELPENSAAYIQNWIAMLKNDKHLLLEAASKAQKAVDYVLMTCRFRGEGINPLFFGHADLKI